MSSGESGRDANSHVIYVRSYVSKLVVVVALAPTTTISRFDIWASGIQSDLNTRLLRPGLLESTYFVHMRSESGHWLL